MRRILALLCAAVALPALGAETLRLNQIQLLGSHNSYKLMMPADAFASLAARAPETAAALEYWHLPLTEQLDLGLRKLELDVFYDPEHTLFPSARPAGAPSSSFPVLHVQNLDDRSSCPNLLACLGEIRTWSDAHPRHLPVFLSFNAKDEAIDQPGFLRPLPFGEDAWLAFDAELNAALGEKLLTPAQVFATGERVWPTLDSARGRVLAILDEDGEKRAAYVQRWRERAMFANLPPEHPGAAILIVNDPIADFERIRALVRAGFVVRTRADADTLEARRGDTLRRERAFASGAQLVSTDYYLPATHFGTDYVVALPGGARCNPLLTRADCRIGE